MQVWLKRSSGSREKIYQFRQCIFPILSSSLFEEERGPSFEKILIPFTQGCFMLSLVEISPVVLEKKMKM